jgi:DNA-binding NtrC family response regulator
VNGYLAGRIRESFRQRISSLPISIDPLRTRQEDIDMLAVLFWKAAYRDTYGFDGSPATELEDKSTYKKALTLGAFVALHEYEWPGNVRQLRNVIETAVAIAGKLGALPLTRAHIQSVLSLSSDCPPDSSAQRIKLGSQESELVLLREVEKAFQIQCPGYDRESGDSFPKGTIDKVHKMLKMAGVKIGEHPSRKLNSLVPVIELHSEELPYLYSYYVIRQKNKAAK